MLKSLCCFLLLIASCGCSFSDDDTQQHNYGVAENLSQQLFYKIGYKQLLVLNRSYSDNMGNVLITQTVLVRRGNNDYIAKEEITDSGVKIISMNNLDSGYNEVKESK